MLSKSQFIRGLQCHKSLWLYKNKPSLRSKPATQEKALFETGNQVGDLACQLFPDGIEIEFNPNDFAGMAQQTMALIAKGQEVIYEATFQQKGLFVMADILVKNDDKWDVYEVKASTKVKEYHKNDAAVQWYALSEVLDLNSISIIHINNQYERQGSLDIHQLFHVENITDIVEAKQTEVSIHLQAMENMILEEEPEIEIGPQCSDPHDCDFKTHCWKDISSPSVFDLYRMRADKKFELYRQGITTYDQIPASQKLSDVQQAQVESYLNQKTLVDKSIIQSFIGTVQYPIHFFDFETFQEAAPRFDGQKPYVLMPFQYSLHIQHTDGTVEHKEYLGDEHTDPRQALAEQMVNDILSHGSLMAYNQSFEKRVIRELAQSFPQYKTELMQIHDRFVDLLDPFRALGYYHPNFNGSFSIKSVLPAMFPNDPELDYKELDIQNGGMAMDTFANLHRLKEPSQRDKIRHDLLAYCHLDTLAMVRIYEKLQTLAKF